MLIKEIMYDFFFKRRISLQNLLLRLHEDGIQVQIQ